MFKFTTPHPGLITPYKLTVPQRWTHSTFTHLFSSFYVQKSKENNFPIICLNLNNFYLAGSGALPFSWLVDTNLNGYREYIACLYLYLLKLFARLTEQQPKQNNYFSSTHRIFVVILGEEDL